MANMSYLVKVPEAIIEAKKAIDSENLLDAHKR